MDVKEHKIRQLLEQDFTLPLNIGKFNKIYELVEEGLVSVDYYNSYGLYNYTKQIIYKKHIPELIKHTRGLILNFEALEQKNKEEIIAALPFRFFYTLDYALKHKEQIDEITIKLDGALAISFWDDNKLKWATRKYFQSDVANAAQQIWDKNYKIHEFKLPKNITLLCEIIHPLTKVLIDYDFIDLVLLGAINRYTGKELKRDELTEISESIGMPIVEKVPFTLEEVLEILPNLTNELEGFIIKMNDGGRVKISNDIYNGVYDLLSNPTPWIISEVWADRSNPHQLLKFIPYKEKKIIKNIFDYLDLKYYTSKPNTSRQVVADNYRKETDDIHKPLFNVLPLDV